MVACPNQKNNQTCTSCKTSSGNLLYYVLIGAVCRMVKKKYYSEYQKKYRDEHKDYFFEYMKDYKSKNVKISHITIKRDVCIKCEKVGRYRLRKQTNNKTNVVSLCIIIDHFNRDHTKATSCYIGVENTKQMIADGEIVV